VVITIDTCRADRIGAYGASLETPAIDSVAERGVAFLQATAPAPLTLPSHATIFTGLDPDRHGVRDNGAHRLSPDARTLAEMLGDKGWATAAFVSAFPLAREFGLDQGFQVYDDTLGASASGESAEAGDAARRIYYDERPAAEVTRAALPWIRERARSGAPFFAWIHYFDPHAEYRPPEPFASRHRAAPYDGEIAYVDAEIARVLDELRAARVQPTIVILGDHGESLGDHGELTHGLFVYESTLRTPWVMEGPRVPKRARIEAPVALADATPTILDALGFAAPDGLDGVSLLPVTRGASAPQLVFGESMFPKLHFGWAELRTVRRGSWKLIDAPGVELYDLAADPHELKNVAVENPEMVSELRDALHRRASRGGSLETLAGGTDDATRARLEALGYVGSGAPSEPPRGADASGAPRTPSGADPKDRVHLFNKYQEVATLIVERRDADAERVIREILDEDSGNVEAVRQLALLRRLQENWTDAAAQCEEILRRVPNDVAARRNLAFASMQTGDDARALRLYDEVTRLDPNDAEAWRMLGTLRAEQGLFREAVDALEEAARIAPHDAGVAASLGRAREESGDAAGAMEDYDRALSIDPGHPIAVVQKGILLRAEGRIDEAVNALRAGLARRPEDAEILNNLAWILVDASIDAEESLELARRAAAIAPDDPAILDTLGWAAVRAGLASDAIDPLRKALAATGDPTVRAHLAFALAATGEREEARAMLREAARRDPRVMELPEARDLR
jgi:arylsulfatase A-like enzyme/tetratricopeptide (TPR) repeat protein